MRRTALVVALSAALAISAAGALSAQPAPPAPIMGTIVSATPSSVVLNTDQGQKTFQLSAKTLVIMRTPATLADVTKGEWIGVDAKKGTGGDLTAVAINIFPNDKVRKGQWLMTSGDTMTNAQVTQMVSGVSGHTILLAYQGGTAKIAVPASATIHRTMLSSASALKPQMRATIRGRSNSDGTWTAMSVLVDSPTAMH